MEWEDSYVPGEEGRVTLQTSSDSQGSCWSQGTPASHPSSCLAGATALKPAISLLSNQWLTLCCPQSVPSSLGDFQTCLL
jgi:hypothetical protein